MRPLLIISSLVVAGFSALAALAPVKAQELDIAAFPASATIRGENIWLRADPAMSSEILDYLQRGDAITVTGEAVAADGEDFYPVEAVDIGETGWIRALFIDPDSVVATVVAAEPPPAEEPPPQQDPRRDRPARRDRQPRETQEPRGGGQTTNREPRQAREPRGDTGQQPRGNTATDTPNRPRQGLIRRASGCADGDRDLRGGGPVPRPRHR
jgi:hypothetical protein